MPKPGELVYIKQLHYFDEYKYPYFEAFGIMGNLYRDTVDIPATRSYFNFHITEPNIVRLRSSHGRPRVYPHTALTWERVRTVSFQKLKLLIRDYRLRRFNT